MTTLSLWLLGYDLLSSAGDFIFATTFVSGLVCFIWALSSVYSVENEDSQPWHLWNVVKTWHVVTVLGMLLFANIIPSEKAFYMVMAVEVSNASLDTEIGQQAMMLLQSKLDNMIEGTSND